MSLGSRESSGECLGSVPDPSVDGSQVGVFLVDKTQKTEKIYG